MKSYIIQSMKVRGLTIPKDEDVEELSKQWESLQREKERLDENLLKDTDIFYSYNKGENEYGR